MTTALHVEPWVDPVLDDLGHDPRSLYCERFWLPLLGPSAVMLARQLADGLERTPTGYDLPAEHAARGLGLGAGDGRRSSFQRTVRRLAQFRVVHLDETSGRMLARRRLPALTRAQVEKLPGPLRHAHAAWRDVDGVEATDRHLVMTRTRLLSLVERR